MALPSLPSQGQDPWYETRTTWDNAVKAELEGRLSEAELTATIGAVSAVDMVNPESALNAATVGVVSEAVGSIDSIPQINDARGNPAKARIGAGPQFWMIWENEANPALWQAGDIVLLVTAEPVPWSPTLLPNKLLWFDAQTLTEADGVGVSSWTDLSGNGDLTQATPGNQPVMDVDAINGHPAVLSDGVDDRMDAVLSSDTSGAMTIYAVAGTTRADDTGGAYLWDFADASDVIAKGSLYRGSDERYAIQSGTTQGSVAGAWTTGVKLIRATYNTADSDLTVDGASVAAGALQNATRHRLRIFGRSDGSNHFQGYVGEFIAVTGIPTTEDDAEVIAYLTDRWGL